MKILVIRRDNIGDLVCTTPLLSSLARGLPGVVIDVLANEYNYQVLERNPHVRRVWVYRKAKHRSSSESFLSVWWSSFKLLLEIRRENYDHVIVASPGFQASAARLARFSGGVSTLGYLHPEARLSHGLPAELASVGHEVEATHRLVSLLGLSTESIPSLMVVPDPGLREKYLRQFQTWDGPTVAIHISARKKSQRWPVEFFVALVRVICNQHGGRVFLFWSPGLETDPLHPGDDAKAAKLMAACEGLPIVPVQTNDLNQLIAALSLADSYIGADGGAMHLAAGVGLPVVALFGDSSISRWRPWEDSSVCLQSPSFDVSDLSVEAVMSAWLNLKEK